MKIGIDGLFFRGKRSGIGRYIFELCREIGEYLPDAEFVVYSNIPVEMPVLSKRWLLRTDPLRYAKFIKGFMWLKCRVGCLCKEDRIDAFWGGATFLPVLPRSIKTIVTVHDVNYKIVPETMPKTTYWAHRFFFEKDVKTADIVIANSEGTAERLYKFIGRSADAVIRPAVSAFFKRLSKAEVDNFRNLYGISYPYILAVGTQEPRKNLELLVKTFLEMKRAGYLRMHKLLLAGSKGWKDRNLARLINDNKIHIVPLGYVPDENLPGLYCGADLFVFPSLYEGFGIPILEARSCGTKIVTSDMPELREAGGDNAIYISPTAEGIRNGILTALNRDEKQILDVSDLPTWKHGAEILATLLKRQLHEEV